jgi:Zn-dependent M28 family amino/carboxypeptidase
MGKMEQAGKWGNKPLSSSPQRGEGWKYLVLLGTIFFFVNACNESNENEPFKKYNVQLSQVKAPAFNADSAYLFIQKQVEFGPRVPNTKGHEQCALYLENLLKKHTPHVLVQQAEVTAFDTKKLKIKNIIASFKPELKNRIALFAHWDTRPVADQDTKDQDKPIDGANDGGSGVGILLEIARAIAQTQPTIGIDIILFDAEDYGQPDNSKFPRMEESYCLGSQYWTKHKHDLNYFAKYGILLDMVGAKNAQFTMEGVSMEYASDIVKKIWNTAAQAGYSDYFVFNETKQIIDDHYYINTIAQIPTVDIIQYDPLTSSNFYSAWHTHNDNMSGIDKNTLKAVGQTLLEVIYREK